MAKNEQKRTDVKKHFTGGVEDATIKFVTVKEFVFGVKNRSSEEARRIYIEGTLAVKDFERYEVVCGICDNLVEQAYFTHDKDGNRTGFKADSCKKYLLYIAALLNTYTNIQFDPEDALGDFNFLCKYGLVDVIISYIPESQIAMFDSVLNMKSNDVMTNYYEPHAFVREQVLKFAPGIHMWLEQFLGAVEDVVKDVDMEKVKGIITK